MMQLPSPNSTAYGSAVLHFLGFRLASLLVAHFLDISGRTTDAPSKTSGLSCLI